MSDICHMITHFNTAAVAMFNRSRQWCTSPQPHHIPSRPRRRYGLSKEVRRLEMPRHGRGGGVQRNAGKARGDSGHVEVSRQTEKHILEAIKSRNADTVLQQAGVKAVGKVPILILVSTQAGNASAPQR